MSIVKSAAAIAAAVVLSVATWSAPAYADISTEGPGPGAGDSPDPRAGSGSDSGGTANGQVRNCQIISSPGYLGMNCGSGNGEGQTLRERLDGDPLPTCWHEPMTPEERLAMGNLENTETTQWYWVRCMTGIDPRTLRGTAEFTITYLPLSGGIVTLTPNQQQVVNWLSRDRVIPPPIAKASPSLYPRVGMNVSFYNGLPPNQKRKVVRVGDVILRGRTMRTYVEPLGEGSEPRIECGMSGLRADVDDTPETLPNACWFRYLKSSDSNPENMYPVNMIAHWVVDYSVDGGTTWTRFNEFDKSQIVRLPVYEIQALNVPGGEG